MNSRAPHIFTLTGNLLAERTLEIPAWTPGATSRATAESFQVGGKGINVSKMLNRLAAPNTALCFAGGAAGLESETWLKQRHFDFVAFQTARATRQGTVVRASNQPETTFLGPNVAPDQAALDACAAHLDRQPAGDILALCGSFPGWETPDCARLREAIGRWLTRGVLVVDAYGPPLEWAVGQPIELLKINASELRTLGMSAASLANVRQIVITDGPNPIQCRTQDGGEFSVEPLRVKEVSPTGSGDVFLACLMNALFRHKKSLREAVCYALPYAAANAAHPGVAEFPEPSSGILK